MFEISHRQKSIALFECPVLFLNIKYSYNSNYKSIEIWEFPLYPKFV